jgi:hypothetical protein
MLPEPDCCQDLTSAASHDGAVLRHLPQPASPSGHGEENSQNLLRNQVLLGQRGKLANHCIVSINMLRSTLHLFILSALFVSSIFVHQDLEWTIPQSPWYPARDEIIAPCWYTLNQRDLFHMRQSAVSFSSNDLPSKEYHQPPHLFNISCSLCVD